MKKENFIYTKLNSLTEPIINEIINNYKFLKLHFDEIMVTDNNFSCENKDYKMLNYLKIKKYLSNEIQTNLYKYIEIINKLSENNTFKVLHNSDSVNISNFNYNKIDTNQNLINDRSFDDRRIEHLYHSKYSIFKEKKFFFLWFLNEYNGEIIFWNNYVIKPKAGMLLIFPSSWCFPFSEFIEENQIKYAISGYVFNYHKQQI
jgi:hypothetical protein